MSIFKQLEQGVSCATPEDTILLAEQFVREVPQNQVIALSGDLGAGKTTFTKGIGKAFGINESSITSPTFNIYTIHQSETQLVHIDAYRLSSSEAVEELMIDEFLKEPWIIVIEWPEKGIAEWMEEQVWKINFTRPDKKSTLITLTERPN